MARKLDRFVFMCNIYLLLWFINDSYYFSWFYYISSFFLNFISGLPRFIPKREREKYLIEDINKLNENNINKEREREIG